MSDVEFQDNSLQIKASIESACIAWLYEAAGEIRSRTQRNARVDTRQTKNSWQYNVDANEKKAVVGNPLENAIWEEFGTGQYALNGDGRKTPWYVPVDGYTGNRKPTYQGKVVVVYGKDGKRFYKTDGKKPQRNLQKAFDSLKNKLQKDLESRMKGIG